ncbi:putative polyketide synthase protein [Botryosphaeria dothidea]|uniref:Polyketide synthase protein n=1 Tax=Botryosphaeria dothidea TaxID=55169 RepID=A0A8H4N7T4_9PEZI|nr:putative polyketide synthase protein [Botryosphaeria dothidea]
MPGIITQDTPSSMPIAIIGIALRAPGDGADSENHAHFLKQDFKVFDAPFFSITPKEAKAMDPMHRMLLETTYEGFENAGLTLDAVKGSKTSVYIGSFTNDFSSLNVRDNEGPSIYHATGLSSSLASNRLSWFYDLKGPSMTIDTACSSSLTAFHLACQSLRAGEASMSVVGGANLMFGPDMSILLGAAKILSPDGKCQMWDAKANGFSRGEGIGITVLKPLNAALRDGDTVRAVVLASATNEDGRTPGISLPSSAAQRELIRTAYAQAGVDPAETGYVEAHGTGTQADDPLEASAILETVGKDRTSDLYVGSVKTNIGHLEGASGVAGIIKAALVVEGGLIPQNLWFEKLNPQINLPENVKIPLELSAWPHDGPRRASINSFGFGGANAHVVLEDAAHYLERMGLKGRHATVIEPKLPCLTNGHTNGNGTTPTAAKPKLFVLSSYDQDGIQRTTQQLQTYLSSKSHNDQPDTPSLLSNLAYTLSTKRTTHPWKSFAITSSIPDLVASLASCPAASRSSDYANAPRPAFVFTGQGAQWFAMGRGLSIYGPFRASLAAADATLRALGCAWSLAEELGRPEGESRLVLAEFSQPACTALQVALADLLVAWGVRPAAVVGHSSGEIAAAYCAGAITRAAAVKIAWLRGRFAGTVAERNGKGAMMAVGASGESLKERLAGLTAGKAVVAAFNSPKACTVSGDEAAVDELQDILTVEQVNSTKLKVEVAYHSPHVEVIREAYETALAGVGTVDCTQNIPMFSSVTGALIQPEKLGPSYWVDNLVSPVNFAGALSALLHHSKEQKRSHDRRTAFASVFVEVGPHSALRSYLDLSAVNETPADASSMLVDLPPYAWNHALSFWEESYLSREHRLRPTPRLDLLGYRVPDSPEPVWRNFLRCGESPWIREHRV